MTDIFAHRGASAIAPENTMAAFRSAITEGADGIELDVQRTRDGVIVVCHDETVDRTSNGTGFIRDLTLDELRTLDFSAGIDHQDKLWFGSSEPIPTLEEVLDLLKPTTLKLNIELKNSEIRYEGMEIEVDAMVMASGMADRVLYSSFNHESMLLLAEEGSVIPRALLYHGLVMEPWLRAKRFGADGIHPFVHLPFLDRVTARSRREGIAVRPWTVDSDPNLTHCFKIGVDAVITNEVSRAIRIRQEEIEHG